jgi:hypothetical protein
MKQCLIEISHKIICEIYFYADIYKSSVLLGKLIDHGGLNTKTLIRALRFSFKDLAFTYSKA